MSTATPRRLSRSSLAHRWNTDAAGIHAAHQDGTLTLSILRGDGVVSYDQEEVEDYERRNGVPTIERKKAPHVSRRRAEEDDDGDPLLTIEQACKLAGISMATLDEMKSRGWAGPISLFKSDATRWAARIRDADKIISRN